MSRIFNGAAKEGSFYTAVALLVVVAAFPFYWMLITAFKTNADLYNVSHIPFWFNDPPTLGHFRYLFEQTLFGRWLLNSLIIGVCVVAITLVAALPAGYSLARMGGRSGEALGIGIFLSYLVPTTLLFLPLSRIITMIGLQNSLWALVVVYPTFTIPFCTWLLMGFFKTVPLEDRGGGDRRRLQPIGQLYQNGIAAVVAWYIYGRDLHLYIDPAGICLRTYLHLIGIADADHARRGHRSGARRHLSTGAN